MEGCKKPRETEEWGWGILRRLTEQATVLIRWENQGMPLEERTMGEDEAGRVKRQPREKVSGALGKPS